MSRFVLIKFLLVLFISFLTNSCNYYDYVYAGNVKKTTHIVIKENSDYELVLKQLEPYLKDIESFKWVAEKKKYPKLIKPGRYVIKEGESNNTIINRLRIGEQDPVQVKLGYEILTKQQLAEVLAKNLSMTSKEFLETLAKKDFINESGLEGEKQLIFFIPDTYEFYWNIKPDHFLDKMKNEYDKFWNDENRRKAKKLGLTVLEVTTLASIVQYETDHKDEQPKVAGLYLNRLKNGIKLQADPTVRYAAMQDNDFKTRIKRIYYKDLGLNSPYNTYKTTGLPPSPIGLATKKSLESTLNPEIHDYLYMCANPEKPGYHVFEKTYEAHQVNAKKYSEWADKNGVN